MNLSKQGDLDNFCGIYSLINVMTYLFGSKLKRKSLYLRFVNEFHKQYSLIDLINSGMSNVEMDSLIEAVLEKGYYHHHYPIQVCMPYRCRVKVKTPQIFNEIRKFINKGDGQSTSVIISTQYHWSVVSHIDKQFIYFLDSSNFNKARRCSFSITNTLKRYQLGLDNIYFFERVI